MSPELVCIALLPFEQWLRSVDPYVVASMLPRDRLTSVDGVMHIKMMGSAALSRQVMGSDPLPESELQNLARSSMEVERQLKRTKRTNRKNNVTK